MKTFLLAFTALGLAALPAPSFAAACHDAHGKFIKCPPPKPTVCHDSHGRFVKCPQHCRDKAGHFVKCK